MNSLIQTPEFLPVPEEKSAGDQPAAPRKTNNVYMSTNATNAVQALDLPPFYDGLPWPAPIGEAAFHGLAGDIVRRIAPHSESAPVALLVTLLLAFGNAAGRGACWRTEDTLHFTNEYAVLVGQSSVARKGTSLDRILALVQNAEVDLFWSKNRVLSGLSSGEGIIHVIRDAKTNAEGVVEDEGAPDKRLFVTESEFAQALSASGRKDNTLGVILRNAWDGKSLRSLIKNGGKGADIASDPHVSILAHITAEELKVKLNATDAVNGFGNRFLWVCVRRAQSLPFGGTLRAEHCGDLMRRVQSALVHAKSRKEVGFTPQAEELWPSLYEKLNQEQTGTLASVTSRAAPHVRRLALLYALLDQAVAADVPHLNAALALWKYCFASAEFIFGGLNATARDIYERLRLAFPGELARTDLFGATNRHIRAEDLTRALAELARHGLATSRKELTSGAPRDLWRLIAN